MKLRENETTDSLVRRFKWMMAKDDPLAELKEREFYRKPAEIRKDERRALELKLRQQNNKKRQNE